MPPLEWSDDREAYFDVLEEKRMRRELLGEEPEFTARRQPRPEGFPAEEWEDRYECA